MCGRFNLIADGAQLALALNLEEVPRIAPRYNIAPTQPVGMVRLAPNGSREWVHAIWGLIPSWSADPRIAARLINARSETVAEKPSFRAAFRRRRCLIPATGFYEWHKQGRQKQAYHIAGQGGALLVFAGLWEQWHGPDGGTLDSCTILTMAAEEPIRPIHDRMPVILSPDHHTLWLDPATPAPLLHDVIAQGGASAAALHLAPVGPFVNHAANEGPECLRPSL
jgi:putative SOS response-associated peptidase YedK